MQFKLYFLSLVLAITAFATPAFSQCPNSAPIDLMQQVGNTVTVGTTLQAPIGNALYVWDFQDGSTGTGQFITHTYDQIGVYVITLTMYDSLQTSWCATGQLTVQINSSGTCDLIPTFTVTNQGGGLVSIGNVQVQNAVLPITYSWYIYGWGYFTTPTFEQVLPNGSYYICLQVTDAAGCVDSTCQDFVITDGPCVNNFLNAQPQVNNQNVNLVVYNWTNFSMPINLYIDYGDGTNQTGVMTSAYTAVHTYPAGGQTYNLCIYGTDANGCTDTLCQPVVTVACQTFPVTMQYVNSSPGVYQFFANASGGQQPYSYSWTFSNGQTFVSDSVGYAQAFFTVPGTYTACVTVTDANGCTGNYCTDVIVTPCNSFAGQITSTTNGLNANFTVGSIGGCGGNTYIWQSGSQTGQGATFQATYSQAGTYPVSVVISDACGCTITVTSSVTIGCNQSAQAVVMHTGNQTICGNQFYDSGNLTGNYLDNENYVLTLYPSTPGAMLHVTFTHLDLETNYDYLSVYDGNDTLGNQLAYLNGVYTNPVSFTSTSTDGSLTFHFTSDFTVTRTGWEAEISCSDLSIEAVNQNNGTWELIANSNQTWSSYTWSVDGVPLSGGSANFTTALPEGQHQLCLTVANVLGCTEQTCTWVNVPCTYQVQASTVVNGNVVTVTITDFNPQYYYSIYTENSWQSVMQETTDITFMTGGTHQICVYSDGICPDSACFNIDLGTENMDVISGYVWDDVNGNGLFDSNESAFANSYVQLCHMGATSTDTLTCIWALTDTTGFYSFSIFPGDYTLTSYIWQGLYVPTLPVGGGGYEFTAIGGQTITGFDFGYQNQAITISGTVFYDTNNNGIQNAGELGAAYKSIQIGNYWTYTDANGFYSLNTIPGTYEVTLTSPGNGYAITVPAAPYTYSVNASTIGQTYPGNNFGLWADPDLIDLSASISHISTVTPGFPVMTYLSYCNNSVTPQSGTFSYYWDPQLAISSPSVFSPAPTTFSAATNTATWSFSNLQPGGCSYIYQNSMAPTTLVLGTPVFNSVVVTPLNDYNPSNNIDTLHQTVVGSWDPNDKQGTPAGIGPANSILPNTELSYTIRFQNTGSAPAVNVVLIDTLSSDFIIETFHMNTASDEYTVHIDQATRVIRWTFNGIMLPDSASDPLGSIGFVNFSILPVSNQLDGTVLTNFADIYFDFNTPIRTNTTLHTIDRGAGIDEANNGPLVSVFPNPFSGSTQFLVNTPDNSQAKIQIYSVLGQVVAEFSVESGKLTTFDATGYAAGMYTYKVISKKANSTGKLIIR